MEKKAIFQSTSPASRLLLSRALRLRNIDAGILSASLAPQRTVNDNPRTDFINRSDDRRWCLVHPLELESCGRNWQCKNRHVCPSSAHHQMSAWIQLKQAVVDEDSTNPIPQRIDYGVGMDVQQPFHDGSNDMIKKTPSTGVNMPDPDPPLRLQRRRRRRRSADHDAHNAHPTRPPKIA